MKKSLPSLAAAAPQDPEVVAPGYAGEDRRRARGGLLQRLFSPPQKRRLADIDMRREREEAVASSSDVLVRRLGAFLSAVKLAPPERAEMCVILEVLLARVEDDGAPEIVHQIRAVLGRLNYSGAANPISMDQVRDQLWALICAFRAHYG